jgi:hypothetical protein
MTASMTDGRTHELRWREEKKEKKDNSKGDRMIGWGIIAPNLRALSLPNRQPLSANRQNPIPLFP